MARKNDVTPDEFSSPYESDRVEGEDYSLSMPELETGEISDPVRKGSDGAQDGAFLRAPKRVPVRRGPLPKKAAGRLRIALIAALALGSLGGLALAGRHYALKSWRFRIESSDQIQVSGNQNVSRAQIIEVFGGDISKNVFAVPLQERRQQLEQIPWIESATLMRYLPNRISVVVKERVPVAMVRIMADDGSDSSRMALIDASGVIMENPGTPGDYSFPVITGFRESEPLSTRAARMSMYSELVRQLDSGGARYSQDLSEVELTDPEDVKITVRETGVLIHLGNSNYLDRYRVFASHIREWQQEYGELESVDLRYQGQWILNPLKGGAEKPASTTISADGGTPASSSTEAVKPAEPAEPKHAVPRRVVHKSAKKRGETHKSKAQTWRWQTND